MRGSVVVALAVLALLATLVDWRLGAALQAVTIGAALCQQRIVQRLALLAEASYPDTVRTLLGRAC